MALIVFLLALFALSLGVIGWRVRRDRRALSLAHTNEDRSAALARVTDPRRRDFLRQVIILSLGVIALTLLVTAVGFLIHHA